MRTMREKRPKPMTMRKETRRTDQRTMDRIRLRLRRR
jgi:hypothetical protein